MEQRTINLLDLRTDGGTQTRKIIHQARIYHFRDCMLEGDIFPALKAKFDGENYWMYSGFHRYHAYKIIGVKEVEVKFEDGSQEDAVRAALHENHKHGTPLSSEDLANNVRIAIELEGDSASDRQIARVAGVSHPFVAKVRRPDAKKQQLAAQKEKKTERQKQSVETFPNKDEKNGAVPDDAEIKAAEMALEADQQAMYKLLESDEPLKTANEEIKRLNHLNSQLLIRIQGLQSERNAAVTLVKQLQKQLDKKK